MAAAIKLVPGIFIPYFWVTGRRREAITATATATFLLCTSLATVSDFRDSRRYWTRLVFDTERIGHTAGYKNQSLRGVLLQLPPGPGRSYVLAVAALIVVIVGLARARTATLRGQPAAGAAICGLTGVLASPVSWIHTAVWLVPAIGCRAGALDKPVRTWIAAMFVLALISGLPYIPNTCPGLPYPGVLLLQRSFALMGLGLLLLLPISGGSRRRRVIQGLFS